jgi:hypothetical protein
MSNTLKEIYDKENNSQREFFMVSHPKLDKTWETTKSNKISIQNKFNHAKSKLDLIENIAYLHGVDFFSLS